SCHGADYAGGTAKFSCLGCHKKGPTACDTCHGQPPDTGAHLAHTAKYDCTACHPKPDVYSDSHPHTGAPRMVATCNQCHGSANPVWTGGPSQAQCGSCHGVPPPSHVDNRCTACHPGPDAPTHADGKLDIGDDSGGCSACHGQPPATGAHVAHMTAQHALSL